MWLASTRPRLVYGFVKLIYVFGSFVVVLGPGGAYFASSKPMRVAVRYLFIVVFDPC